MRMNIMVNKRRYTRKGELDMDYRYSKCYPPPMPYRPEYPSMGGRQELAEAYIPYQQYTTSFPPMEALEMGTMFPELVRPYTKRDCEGGGAG